MNNFLENKTAIFAVILAIIIILVMNQFTNNSNTTQQPIQNVPMDAQRPQIIQPKPDSVEQIYTAILPSASGQRVVKLVLSQLEAKMTDKFVNGEPEIVQAGTYTRAGDFISVLLVDKNGQKLETPQDLSFKVDEKGNLTLINPESEGFGAEGLLMYKSNNTLIGTSWVWTETQMNDGLIKKPNDRNQFKLTFNESDKFNTTTDCNNGMGSYTVANGNILIEGVATTKKFCQDSKEVEYITDLQRVQGYMVEDKKLVLMLSYDSGNMIFEKAE